MLLKTPAPEADVAVRRAFATFDAYLDGPAHHAVGVAVSGGGDSVALLYALAEWKKRPLEVFCVDHGLNPASADWTAGVARHAAAVGAGFEALDWTGAKPSMGLSARARQARHALLAEAARRKNVHVLCLAHSRDDILEAELMRAEGSNVGAPDVWRPSPVWPEGRGVFLLRPFLDQRRETLRSFLGGRGIGWIDDPANENPASLRARARKVLKAGDLPDAPSTPDGEDVSLLTQPMLLRDAETLGSYGMIVFDADVFEALPRHIALARLAQATVCAGGGDRLPRRAGLERLLSALPSGEAQTLCGARLQRRGDRIEITREAGDMGRKGMGNLVLAAGAEVMWDGRFAIRSGIAANLWPSGRVRAELDAADRAALMHLPPAVRTTLPVLETAQGMKLLISAQALADPPDDGTKLACWVLPRFLAAAGVWGRESDLCTS